MTVLNDACTKRYTLGVLAGVCIGLLIAGGLLLLGLRTSWGWMMPQIQQSLAGLALMLLTVGACALAGIRYIHRRYRVAALWPAGPPRRPSPRPRP